MSSLPRKGRSTSSASDTSNIAGSFHGSSTRQKKTKLSSGSFKGQFGSNGADPTSGIAPPSIALTSSTGTSSYLHRPSSSSEDGADANTASARSSFNKFASRASDIQSYASRYLDSIRSKSKSIGHTKAPLPSLVEVGATSSSVVVASSRSMSPTYTSAGGGGSSIPYLLTFRHGNRVASERPSTLSRPASFLHQRPYSLSPPPTTSTTTIASSSSSISSATSSRSNYSEPRCATMLYNFLPFLVLFHAKFTIFSLLFFRWFRHITEASNAYRARDTRGRGRGLYPADPLNNGLESSGDRGKADDHLGLPGDSALDKKGQPAGRSQSFHESSTSSRELHSERQPSSPPEERGPDSHAKKAGKFR